MDKCTFCAGGREPAPGSPRNTRNTAPTGWPKASCRCAPRCAPPSRCSPGDGDIIAQIYKDPPGPAGRLQARLRFRAPGAGSTAYSWCILAISGLNIVAGRVTLLPLIGNDAFSTLSTWLKYSHNFLAFPFTMGVILMLLVWVRHNIPNKVDVAWFKAGGGFIGHGHPPAGKFNGGQKAVFWIVVLGGGGLAVTGLGLMFPFYVTNVFGMQIIQVVHGGIALAMIAAMLGHIYIGSVGMEGALDAMNSGDVDLGWAKAHHSLWVEEELAKATRPQPSPAE
jgi:formate dehydrogenase subunit gamma